MSNNPGHRFRKPRYRVVVIFRKEAHPATFNYYYVEDYRAKLSEISKDMDRRKPDEIKYAYACGGELEHTDDGVIFHNHHQVTCGFNTYPKHLYAGAPSKPNRTGRVG